MGTTYRQRTGSSYSNKMTNVAGVDGCPKGWIGIVLEDGRFERAEFSPTFAELLTRLTDTEVIAVDIGPNTAHSFPGRFSGQAGPGAAERSIQRLGGELVLQIGVWHHY